MSQIGRKLFYGVVSVFAFATVGITTAKASDSAAITVRLENTGIDVDARATLVATLNAVASSVSVQASKLAPRAAYSLTVDGVTAAGAPASSLGTLRLSFSNPRKPYQRLLEFDPRGRTIAIVDEGGNPVLRGIISAPGEPQASSVVDRTSLARKAAKPTESATAQVVYSGGEHRFDVLLTGVRGSNWWLYVDGSPKGELKVSRGAGRLRFREQPKVSSDHLLEFEPRGRVIDIVQGSQIVFSGPMEARARNINFASPSVRPGAIPSTGLDPDGLALTRTRVNRDASKEFKVELEKVPAGEYEVLVNGNPVGSIQVSESASGPEGELEFAANSDDVGKLPLTFDPASAEFTIRQGESVFFQGRIVKRIASLGGGTDPTQIEETLASSGLDGNASGDAKYEIQGDGREKFSVEIEDVPAGKYELWVGSILRAHITSRTVDDRVRGEVEFSSGNDDPHQLPLNFDPRGETLVVRSSTGTYFTHLFGSGAASDEVAPLETELPLFAVGKTGGRAEAKFERDDRGERSFEVELENVVVGTYTLAVGGSVRGTIEVTEVSGGTRGQIEFQDEPSNGEQELNFDPLGQSIEVSRDGVNLFERTLPVP